jgi:hypothetical protein
MYQSECIAVSGVKGSGREILKFLIQAFWDVALFQLVKGNIPQKKLLTSSATSSGRIMVYYQRIMVNVVCFFKA